MVATDAGDVRELLLGVARLAAQPSKGVRDLPAAGRPRVARHLTTVPSGLHGVSHTYMALPDIDGPARLEFAMREWISRFVTPVRDHLAVLLILAAIVLGGIALHYKSLADHERESARL